MMINITYIYINILSYMYDVYTLEMTFVPSKTMGCHKLHPDFEERQEGAKSEGQEWLSVACCF